ncbi:MAG: T9SS type A sorting domain-containing protein [Flavobacteriia bacterium]
MKKLIFSIALLTGLNASAQLPDGSIAPDFTLTDINGNTHNLYTYLDQGKTVFIDVSATWCGPCWNFHETGALDDLWANHGPAGGNGVSANTTDDVIVIFIEGDATTTDAELHGGAGSQGDWVTGVDHPIIDLAPGAEATNFDADYQIGYFPTIYKICPNRIISEPGQASAAVLYSGVADCPAPASTNIDVAALSYAGNNSICGPANYTPVVKIQNYGFDPLTDATVTISMGGNVVSTGTYTGSLNTYEFATVTCSAIADFSGGNLEIDVTTTNDGDAANGTMAKTVLGAVETTSRVLLTIKTDAYASEISWNIKNANNQNVAGTTDPTLANNTVYNFTYNMSALGCYTYNITDSYGDGISSPGYINVRDNNNLVILNTEDYGDGTSIPFKVVTMLADAPTLTSNKPIENGTITACEGTSVTLTSSSTNGNSWSTNQTTQNITVTTSGTYSVTVNGVESAPMVVSFISCAGVDEETINNVVIYPNPSNGVFVVKGNDLVKFNVIEVVDNAGRVISSIPVNKTELSFNLEGLSAGNYLVVFKGENGNVTQKIQINK